MGELEKIIRVIKKVDPTAPHATLLTLDATTGQNALNQVEIFGKRAGVTGLVMTKLDGTARGGSWWRSQRNMRSRCTSSGSARASTISSRSPRAILPVPLWVRSKWLKQKNKS